MYRLITQKLAINLIHSGSPSPPRGRARENNNRHKLSTEIALVLHDPVVGESNPRRGLADGFRHVQTRANTGAARFNGFAATYPLRTRRLYYMRLRSTLNIPGSTLEVLEARPIDPSCDHADAHVYLFYPKAINPCLLRLNVANVITTLNLIRVNVWRCILY